VQTAHAMWVKHTYESVFRREHAYYNIISGLSFLELLVVVAPGSLLTKLLWTLVAQSDAFREFCCLVHHLLLKDHKVYSKSCLHVQWKQGVSNTHPANIRKNKEFQFNIKLSGLFFQIQSFLTENSIFLSSPPDLTLSLMLPARHLEFETIVL